MAENSSFARLIERYADGRTICNCRESYLSPCGHAIVNGKEVFDAPTCKHGCTTNLIQAKYYVADRVVAEYMQKCLSPDLRTKRASE